MNPERRQDLWRLTRGQRLRYASSILAMWLGIGFAFAVPMVTMAAMDALGGAAPDATERAWMQPAVEWIARNPSRGQVLAAAATLVVACSALSGLGFYLRGRWASQAAETIARRLRERLYAHLGRLPCATLDAADTGDLVQRCTSDVETVRAFLATQVVEIGRAVLMLATCVPLMAALHGPMALVSVALFPAVVAFAVVFFRRVKRLFLEADEAEGALTSVLQENLTGIRVVRAFARQEHEITRFAERNDALRDRIVRLMRLLSVYWSSSDLLCIAQIGMTLLAGARWMAADELSVGAFYAFLMIQALVIWPVRQMGRVLSETGKAVVALGRVGEILAEPEESTPARCVLPEQHAFGGSIEIERLTFAHGSGEPVLRELDLSIAPGETVALVGPPGAGKSTLVHLLLRLYDYRHGSIRIDGYELRDVARARARGQIGAVLQEPFLYSKSVRDNLRVGRPEATEDELNAALEAAALRGSVEGFSDGLETLVGERGVTLSGGERQRMAIARALLADPPILILDDALSAVDTRTEQSILAALRARSGTRTTILVAHRLSSVAAADRIVVLDAGRVAQAGTHDELARREGPYRRLWRIQGALEDELRGDVERTRTRPASRAAASS